MTVKKTAAKPVKAKEPEMGAVRSLVAANPNAVTSLTAGGALTTIIVLVAQKFGVDLDTLTAVWIGAALSASFQFLSTYGISGIWFRFLRGKQ